MKKWIAGLAVLIGLGGLVGCTTDADVASKNISEDADNFKILREIVAVNTFTDSYLLSIEGWCNIHFDREDSQLEVTCKLPDGYKKHFVGISDNVTYVVQQKVSADVSVNHYKVTFKPSTIVPDVEAR